jgi:hypothetical protein
VTADCVLVTSFGFVLGEPGVRDAALSSAMPRRLGRAARWLWPLPRVMRRAAGTQGFALAAYSAGMVVTGRGCDCYDLFWRGGAPPVLTVAARHCDSRRAGARTRRRIEGSRAVAFATHLPCSAVGGTKRGLGRRLPFQPGRRERRIPFPLENPARGSLTATGPPRQAVRAVTAREDEPVGAIDRAVQRKAVE